MEQFNASLVREKFTIRSRDGDNAAPVHSDPMIIASNRVVFHVGEDGARERIVVRARNTYVTLILASMVLRSYHNSGLFLKRDVPCDWQTLWNNAVSSYEEKYNDNLWGAIYVNHKSVFKYRANQFLDVIEQCAALTDNNYDIINSTLQDMLDLAGTKKDIIYDNICVTEIRNEEDHIFCEVVCRNNGVCTDFDFNVTSGVGAEERMEQAMLICAAHLEICDLDFYIDRTENKINSGEVDEGHPEMQRFNDAILRKNRVLEYLQQIESKFDINYFSGKPNS